MWEQHAGLAAVAGVDLSFNVAASAGGEVLAIGRGGCSAAPVSGEAEAVLVVDHLGKRFGVGLFADVPLTDPRELCGRRAGAGVGHLRGAEVDPVGEDGGQ